MKMWKWVVWGSSAVLGLALGGAVGCDNPADSEQGVVGSEQEFGKLRLPLVTPAQEQYRLRDALFDITRAELTVVTLDSEVNPDALALDADLLASVYQITLRDGWRLERLDANGAVPVSAALLTPNPQAFEVENARVTELVYSFTTDQGVVSFGRGSVSVSVQVTPSGALASCELLDASSCASGQTCLLADDSGKTFCAVPGALELGSPCSSEQCVAGAQCLALDDAQPDQRVCTRFCNPALVRPGCECQALASPAGVGVCVGGGGSDVFSFSGIATELPVAALEGWSLCYADAFGDQGPELTSIFAQCNQRQLLVGCREAGSDILRVAANALSADVTFDTGTGNEPHVANGVGWYFNDSFSWGFAPEGAPIERNSCDVISSPLSGQDLGDGSQRLCFHTDFGTLTPGWRCGTATDIFDSSFERVVFHAP